MDEIDQQEAIIAEEVVVPAEEEVVIPEESAETEEALPVVDYERAQSTLSADEAEYQLVNMVMPSQAVESTYHFRFGSLRRHVWYRLIVKTSFTASQSAGVKAPVQVSTVSSLHSSAITYDENPVFSGVFLNKVPLNTMSIVVRTPVSEFRPASQQTVRLTLTPTFNVTSEV